MDNFEQLNDMDREIWAEELEEFVPHRIFDAHVHLWSNACMPDGPSAFADCDFETIDRFSRMVFPGREVDYLMLGTPVPGMDEEAFNRFMAGEMAKARLKLAATIVTPAVTPGSLAEAIEKYHFCGLKPYRLFAADPANCRITDYLPESLIEIADHYNLCITMHMAKMDGIADPENLADLQYLTGRYPNVCWILAHCARAFNPYTLEKNVFKLREMSNIRYDLSAVCDARSIYLLLKHEDTSRLMFGTDNIMAGGVHAKYITWGKGWQYFTGMDLPHCRGGATFVCYEQLRAMKQACDMAGITSQQQQDIFYGNAKRFFGF